MESVYSALILHSAGKKVTEAAIKKILDASGAKVDNNQVKALVAGLKDKNLDDIIASAAAAPVAAAAPTAAKEEAPKEKKIHKQRPSTTRTHPILVASFWFLLIHPFNLSTLYLS